MQSNLERGMGTWTGEEGGGVVDTVLYNLCQQHPNAIHALTVGSERSKNYNYRDSPPVQFSELKREIRVYFRQTHSLTLN